MVRKQCQFLNMPTCQDQTREPLSPLLEVNLTSVKLHVRGNYLQLELYQTWYLESAKVTENTGVTGGNHVGLLPRNHAMQWIYGGKTTTFTPGHRQCFCSSASSSIVKLNGPWLWFGQKHKKRARLSCQTPDLLRTWFSAQYNISAAWMNW